MTTARTDLPRHPLSRRRIPSWFPLAGLLATAGSAHFLVPAPFRSIVPRRLGDPAPWVAVSGLAEIACAAGLLRPATRRPAALAAAALFVAVFPANVQMALTALRSPRAATAYRVGLLARLPMQAPLVWWALRVADAAGRDGVTTEQR